jgi:hypothetical protein
MSYRILILASAAVFGVCDGPADDDPLATCDRIAEKYVAAFAAKDVEGPAREKALDKCVLGPEQDYTDAGRTWVACMESAASPAQMVKCQKEFQATLVNEKLSTIGGDDPRGEGDGLRRDDEGGRNDRAPDRGQRGRFRENRRGVRRANRDCQERDGWTRCRAVEDRALQIDLEGLFPDHENRPSRRSYEHSGQIRPLLWFGGLSRTQAEKFTAVFRRRTAPTTWWAGHARRLSRASMRVARVVSIARRTRQHRGTITAVASEVLARGEIGRRVRRLREEAGDS